MKFKELVEKDEKALKKLLLDTQAKILKDRFAIAGREMTNVAEVNKSRKLIAKINTLLRQKQILATENVITKAKTDSKKPEGKVRGDK